MYVDIDNKDTIRPTHESILTSPTKLTKSFQEALEFIKHINHQFYACSFMDFDIDKKYGIDVEFLRNVIIDALDFANRFCDSEVYLRRRVCGHSATFKISRSERSQIEVYGRAHDYTIHFNPNSNPYDTLYEYCVNLYALNYEIDNDEIEELIIKKFDENSYSDGVDAYNKILKHFENDRETHKVNESLIYDFIEHVEHKNDTDGVFNQLQESVLYAAFLDMFALSRFGYDLPNYQFMKGLEFAFNERIVIDRLANHQKISYKRIKKHLKFLPQRVFKKIIAQIFDICNKNRLLAYDIKERTINYDSFLETYQNYIYANHVEYYGKFLTPFYNRFSGMCTTNHREFAKIIRELLQLGEMSDEERAEYYDKKEREKFLDEIFSEV